MTQRTLTQSYLKECLWYLSDSGIFIWKIRPRAHFHTEKTWKIWLASRAGKRAGEGNSKKRNRIRINDELYFAHHLAWLYHYGDFPKYQIDHIDHNPSNNRISNLRDVPHISNIQNQSLRSTNKSGVTGVCWSNKAKSWRATIMVNCKHIPLKLSKDFNEAVQARADAERRYGFHENHGK